MCQHSIRMAACKNLCTCMVTMGGPCCSHHCHCCVHLPGCTLCMQGMGMCELNSLNGNLLSSSDEVSSGKILLLKILFVIVSTTLDMVPGVQAVNMSIAMFGVVYYLFDGVSHWIVHIAGWPLVESEAFQQHQREGTAATLAAVLELYLPCANRSRCAVRASAVVWHKKQANCW